MYDIHKVLTGDFVYGLRNRREKLQAFFEKNGRKTYRIDELKRAGNSVQQAFLSYIESHTDKYHSQINVPQSEMIKSLALANSYDRALSKGVLLYGLKHY